MTHQNTIDGNNTNDCIQPEATVTEDLVPDHERLSITADLFGFFFPMKLEPAIYQFAETLSDDYRGGYWTFYHLSNGGFYMAPDQNEQFEVQSLNDYEGSLCAEALGIAVFLYAYSHLSFGDGGFAESCTTLPSAAGLCM